MNLYIRLTDGGNAFEHPILEENLISAFPGIDLNNLPAGLARFVRVPQPSQPLGLFEKWVCTYVLMEDGKTYTDIWSVEAMSQSEQLAITQDQIRNNNTILTNRQVFAQSVIQRMDDSVNAETKIAWINYTTSLSSIDFTDPFNVNWPVTPELPAPTPAPTPALVVDETNSTDSSSSGNQ